MDKWRPPAERLYTLKEVAALMGVQPRTVGRWVRAGRLASVRTLGNHHRVKEADVAALMKEQREGEWA